MEIPRTDIVKKGFAGNIAGKVRRKAHSILCRYIPGYYSLCLLFNPRIRKNLIYTDPSFISKAIFNHEKFNLKKTYGIILDGNWDLETHPLDDFEITNSFKAHFIENIPFRETKFYRPDIKTREDWEQFISEGSRKWEYITEFEFEERTCKLDDLYASMKKHGFLSQRRTGGPVADEVRIRIGRYGQLLFENSIHRFIISKLLGIRRIPVLVTARHPEWIKFKEEIAAYLKDHPEIHAHIEYPPLHPDLGLQSGTGNHQHPLYKITEIISGFKNIVIAGSGFDFPFNIFQDGNQQCFHLVSDSESLRFSEKISSPLGIKVEHLVFTKDQFNRFASLNDVMWIILTDFIENENLCNQINFKNTQPAVRAGVTVFTGNHTARTRKHPGMIKDLNESGMERIYSVGNIEVFLNK